MFFINMEISEVISILRDQVKFAILCIEKFLVLLLINLKGNCGFFVIYARKTNSPTTAANNQLLHVMKFVTAVNSLNLLRI